MKRWMIVLCAIVVAAAAYGDEQSETKLTMTVGSPGMIDESLANEAKAAIDRGVEWLLAKQAEDGSWSNAEFPALTGLPLWALALTKSSDEDAIDNAVKFILQHVHDDGSIYVEPSEERKGGGLKNYNTAICMVALHQVGFPELIPVIQKARQFVAKGQHMGDDVYKGGMGYDEETGRPYADLSNSYMAYEAMKLTESVEDMRKENEGRADLDWDAAIEFVEQVQNRPESNEQPWATDEESESGGFAYSPTESKAGTFTDDDGNVRFRSYGSMTYAGLLSFIYADVSKDDPRVQSAYDWATKYWTLEENPGMDQQGLYYFYNVLSKGMAAMGQDQLTTIDGEQLNWRKELITKLVNLQKIDPDTGGGYWINDAGRWWENDPVLVTAYTLIALQIALN